MKRKDKFKMDESQLLAMIKMGVAISGSQKALAEKMRVSPSYLNDVIQGKRDVGQKILDFYGLNRNIFYSLVGEPNEMTVPCSTPGCNQPSISYASHYNKQGRVERIATECATCKEERESIRSASERAEWRARLRRKP